MSQICAITTNQTVKAQASMVQIKVILILYYRARQPTAHQGILPGLQPFFFFQ